MSNDATLKPITQGNLVNEVERRLRRMIQQRCLKAGDPLPAEMELAAALNVGRNVVREAVSALRLLGMIESRRSRGMVLAEPDLFGGLERLLQPSLLSPPNVRALCELRLVIELGIADLLVARHTPKDLEKLEAIVRREEERPKDVQLAVKCDREFHAHLYQIAGNAVVARFQDLLGSGFFESQFERGFDPQRFTRPGHANHRDLLETIRRGTAAQYQEVVRRHLTHHLKAFLTTEPAPPKAQPRLNQKLLAQRKDWPADLRIGAVKKRPERILQFGEGGFLRAFVDWMINKLNATGKFDGSVVVVQPIEQGFVDELNAQDGLYTLLLRGIQDGKVVESKEIITSISRGINPYRNWQAFLDCAANSDLRFVVSNTTEAGITYVAEARPTKKCPASFPAKVAALLAERYARFNGAADKGLVFLPCELIDRNGENLKATVLRHIDAWGLDAGLRAWICEHNHFLNTLVDRIVVGYPKDEAKALTGALGYEDKLLDTGEIFHLWVIEGDKRFAAELPLAEAGLQVVWTNDLQPYRTRKVRILNGAHTMTSLAAYLCGIDTVRACVEEEIVGAYMRMGVFQEIMPLLNLPESEKKSFAAAVMERFGNPFIQHYLLSIALNSVSKFKVRVLPSLLDFVASKGKLPPVLSFSLAALIAFYRGTEIRDAALQGERNGQPYAIKDDAAVLEFFAQQWRAFDEADNLSALTRAALGNAAFWGQDLNTVPGLADRVTRDLHSILQHGVYASMKPIAGPRPAVPMAPPVVAAAS